jgi:hypothetical protein
MARIECSVWTNGGNGWGLRVLGGTKIRKIHFDRHESPVRIEFGAEHCECNVDKDSFWNDSCGELISKSFLP